MAQLDFSSGIKTYTFKGEGGEREVRYNPTDSRLIARMMDAFTRMEEADNRLRNEMKKVGSNLDPEGARRVLALCNDADKLFRSELDGLFGEGLCDLLFGDVSLYAMQDGAPLWANFIFSVFDTMDEATVEEGKKTNPKLDKYLKKYAKPAPKRARK